MLKWVRRLVPQKLVPKIERETLLGKLTQWSRSASLFFLAACPLLLIWQLIGWVQVRFWADISVGSMMFPDPIVAREFSHSRWRLLNDMLWIPLWFECLVAAITLFVIHMILWNRMDMRRQARRRSRRAPSATGPRKRRTPQ